MKSHYDIWQPWVMVLCLLCLMLGAGASLSQRGRDFLLGNLVRSDTSKLETFARHELAALGASITAAEALLRQKWPVDSRQAAAFAEEEKTQLNAALNDARHLLAQRPLPGQTIGLKLNGPAMDRALLLDTLRRGAAEAADLLANPAASVLDRLPRGARQRALNSESNRIKDLPQPLITAQKVTLLHICGVLGALGAGVQGVWSIAIYAGNRRFRYTWSLFYFVRPFVGSGLAIIFCFLIEGGFVQIQPEQVNAVPDGSPSPLPATLYAFGALSLVIGLFVGEAMEKLRKIAASVFTANEYSDTLTDRSPVVERSVASPASDAADAPWQISLEGRNLGGAIQLFLKGEKFDAAHAGDGALLFTVPANIIGNDRRLRAALVRVEEPAAVSPPFELKFPKKKPANNPPEVVPVGGA